MLICGESVRFKFNGDCRTLMVFSRCHTNTLCTMAPPQNTMPTPINMLVTMAGVEWNCVKVYRIIPVKKMGIEMKNPPTAHTLLTLDFCKYLFPLPVVAGARTNLTANRNWMAHTSRQHRFNDSERAHSASVTS